MNAKVTALDKNFCLFVTDTDFDPADYPPEFRIRRSGVNGQHRFVDGKLVDVSGVQHWIAEPEFAAVIRDGGQHESVH